MRTEPGPGLAADRGRLYAAAHGARADSL